MKITTKRELYIERERTVTIRLAGGKSARFCDGCGNETTFITVDEAAVWQQTTAREIYRLVENNQIHSADASEGSLLVCLNSLLDSASEIKSTNKILGVNKNETNTF